MSAIAIDPTAFVGTVRPLLQKGDSEELRQTIMKKWSGNDILSLLSCQSRDARKVAALCLAVVGQRCCISPLAEQLRDRDPVVNQMAEHALWAIWLRLGSHDAVQWLTQASNAIEDAEFELAIECSTNAITADASFAEAYNQRAIAYYLNDELEASIADCRTVIQMMPVHFNAWAQLGHAYAQMGKSKKAIDCYRQALMINPHMTHLHEVIDALAGESRPDSDC